MRERLKREGPQLESENHCSAVFKTKNMDILTVD
jgi:hypothetical protein